MLKAFLKDSAVYGFANMLTRAIQLLLVPLYTRVLSPAAYGSVDMMMVVTAVALSVLTLEVAQGMARAYGDIDDPAQRIPYASTTLWFTVGAACVLAVVAVVGGSLSQWVLGPGMEAPFRVACLVIAVQLLYNLFITQLRFELRAGMFAMTSVLFTLISNSVAVVLIVWADTGVIGVFYGQLVGYLVAGLIAAIATRRAYRVTFDRAKCREMIRYAAPLVFSVIGGHVAMLSDRVLIKALMGLHEVGVYGIGARVASTVGLLLSAFGSALTPLILTRYRDPDTPAHVARMYRVFLLLVLPILAGLTIFAHEIVRILATPEYYEAAEVIPPLTLAMMFSGMVIFAPGMQIARKTRLLALIMVVTGFENVALNLVLIPDLGVTGAALATMISAATGFIAYMTASQRFYPVPHSWRRVGGASVVALAAAGSGYALSSASLGVVETIAAKAAVWIATCLGFAAMLLDRRDLRIVRDRLTGATATGAAGTRREPRS